MKIFERLRREVKMRPVIAAGYSRKMAALWYRRTQADYKNYQDRYSRKEIKSFHDRGYLCRSADRYDLLHCDSCKYMTDFAYLYLSPFNNSFAKWIGDLLTTSRVLKDCSEHCRTIYFSLVHRGSKLLILKVDDENREYTVDDIIALVREKKVAELRPAHWNSVQPMYKLEYADGCLHIDGEPCGEAELSNLLGRLESDYLVADYVDLYHKFSEELSGDFSVKLWIANDAGDEPQILSAEVSQYRPAENPADKEAAVEHTSVLADAASGRFVWDGTEAQIDGWDEICRVVRDAAKTMNQLTYFSAAIALGNGDEPFRFLNFSASPYLPETAFNDELNDYLKSKWAVKNANRHVTLSDRAAAAKNSLFYRFVKKHVRKGMRPYMYRLWLDAVKSDLRGTKGVPLGKKIWAWKRGFLSYRIKQYGLTEENYREFLSDFDYFWLNRINNDYQIWVNDKTTFRYLMEPFKAYIPDYYLSLFKRSGDDKVCVARMCDCPEGIEGSVDGLCRLLKEKKKLAMKASAGTHGDGFYCLAYEDGQMTANGQVVDRDGLEELINGLRSYYVVTEYIQMHDDMKKIYARSVNSIRVMVINADGYNPEIMQTYMRIGSSKTGYTDNVGYGGICAMVDRESGELYRPETITNHVFNPCPTHPDTGTPIAGKIPNWELICTKIKEICRYMAELEYLGFDIAVTNDGFRVIEINIHQDLHKVATFSDEIKAFFKQKISDKRNAEMAKETNKQQIG